VNQSGARFQPRSAVKKRRDQRGIAEEQEFTVRLARQRKIRAPHDDARAVIPSHSIERNSDFVCH
jgi:hypothetical protein